MDQTDKLEEMSNSEMREKALRAAENRRYCVFKC